MVRGGGKCTISLSYSSSAGVPRVASLYYKKTVLQVRFGTL